MNSYLGYAADLVAITVMVFVLFLPRGGRRELVVAYLAVNVGVLAVAAVLSSSGVSAGLGLGIFGVLSIIRLRSEELSQREVAYYFVALALGLLGGLAPADSWLAPGLMVALLAVLWIGDHQRLAGGGGGGQELVIDRAITDPSELASHLTVLLGAEPGKIEVRRTDLVNDTTTLVVRGLGGSR
ncbi:MULTISPECIES: DUF4956 domain-containing protein [Aeromicrobium]|uniref:DUF4956 domain-containing protein n=1 Tax=Aeromicrobium phoceense TaxID=2754045 RepID=A0A838XNI1_9ACTN|nr:MULTISPECIES: DUF4956 domain-containing protein [Aeromicrobium]MBA4608400.1 DUF4956 domain-containing protein [Aeromicrobium phoceense]